MPLLQGVGCQLLTESELDAIERRCWPDLEITQEDAEALLGHIKALESERIRVEQFQGEIDDLEDDNKGLSDRIEELEAEIDQLKAKNLELANQLPGAL